MKTFTHKPAQKLNKKKEGQSLRLQFNYGKTFRNFFSVLYVAVGIGNFSAQEKGNFKQNHSTNTPEKHSTILSQINSIFSHKNQTEGFRKIKEEIKIAQSRKDDGFAGVLYGVEAINYRLIDNFAASERSLILAKNLVAKSSSKESKGYIEYCEGWINSRNGKQEKAIVNILKALNYYDASPTSFSLNKRKSTAYNELSVIYANLGDDELNEKYAKLALDYAQRQTDVQVLFSANMKMGNLYDALSNKYPENTRYRNLAEKYFLKSIEIFKKNEALMNSATDLSYAANNLASLYLYNFPATYQKQAYDYATLANQIALKEGKADHIASSFGILSEIALAQNDTEKAIFNLLEAKNALKKSTLIDRNIELNINESLVDIYEKSGRYKEAVQFQKEYMALFKELYNHEKLAISKKLEAQFDKERQQQKYVELELESEKRAQQIKLMNALANDREQTLNNLKLLEENHKEKLKSSELEAQKKAQQLKLSLLQTKQKNQSISNFKKVLAYKEKVSRYYILFILFCILFIALLIYSFLQRMKHMKQKVVLQKLALEKQRQNSKISTLTALLEGQEMERGRLAKDLHDGLGGLLSGTKLQLEQLSEVQTSKEGLTLEKPILQIDDAIEELRRVAHNLMPDLLVKFGFEVAVKEFASRMSSPHLDIHVEFLSYTDPFDEEQKLFIYRIIQELVNNAIKHANPTEIIIQVSEDKNRVMLVVEDNGRGFDTTNLEVSKSAGFHNIQSRLEFLKGKISIQSQLDTGTSVELEFPKN